MGTRESIFSAALLHQGEHLTAEVVAVNAPDDGLVLSTIGGQLAATVAVSCLVRPLVGDLVEYVFHGEAGLFVVGILKRPSHAPLTVPLPPGSSIDVSGGPLELRADALSLRARAFAVEGSTAHLSVDKIVGVGRSATWSFGVVKLTAELMESFAERLVQFSRWSQRMVDGPDMVRSRQIDYRAEQTLQLQANTVIANADKLFKADGEQIHLG